MNRIFRRMSLATKSGLAIFALLIMVALPAPQAHASTTTISGKVSDAGNAGVVGATVTFTDTTNAGTVTATTDASGNYSAALTTFDYYNLQASPPGGASLVPTAYLQVRAVGTTQAFNFVLRASAHTVTGVVQDKNGVVLPNETVKIQDTTGTLASAVTDTNGAYTMTAPAYASYVLKTTGTKTAVTAYVPDNFIWNLPLDLTSDSTTPVVVQAVVVAIAVREPSGAVPVAMGSTSINITSNHTTASFNGLYYGNGSGSGYHPDANGNLNLILVSNSVYSLSVIGSSFDGYGTTTVPSTSLGSSDTTLTVTLPTNRHTISGTLTRISSENGGTFPMAGITVSLGCIATNRYQSATTDVNGHYSFTAGANATTGTAYSLSLSKTNTTDVNAITPGTLNASMTLDLSLDRTGDVAFTMDPSYFAVFDTLTHIVTTNVKINAYGSGTLPSPFIGAGTMTTTFSSNFTGPAWPSMPTHYRTYIHGLTYNQTISGPVSPATAYGSVTINGYVPCTNCSQQLYLPNNMPTPTSVTNTTTTPGYPTLTWGYPSVSAPYVADHFNIYVGSEVIGTTTTHTFTDTSVSGTNGQYYQVSAVNSQGTEGPRTTPILINYTTP